MIRGKAHDPTKRVMDVGVSAALLLLTSPLQFMVGVLILRDMGRPVLFRQERPGRDGETFELIKFRTMLPDTGDGAAPHQRITKLGRRLRSTSLDELPTLLNVFRGDMALVGPRPLLPEYLNHYNSVQARRHEVRPGVTGLAQVSGRNGISWEQKFELDVRYVDSRSLLLDFRILLATVRAVARRDGIDASAGATMPRFRGTAADDS